MALTARVRPAAGEPEGALVLFHGRGADEHDLFPLLDALDPERRFVGATPRGPLSLPPGGAHWYVLGGIGTPEATTFNAELRGGVCVAGGFLARAWRELGARRARWVLAGRRDDVCARARSGTAAPGGVDGVQQLPSSGGRIRAGSLAAAAARCDRPRQPGSGDRRRVGAPGTLGAGAGGCRGALPRDADVPPDRSGVRG